MLSRVAESLFWMSRYFERAENTARFLDVNTNMQLDLNRITTTDGPECCSALILVAGDRKHYETLYDDYDAHSVTDYLIFNRQNPNSVISCIGLARENARSIIESISSEMWEQINDLYHFLKSTTPHGVENDPFSFYRHIKNASHLFQGITDNTFSRSEGWDFIQAGKYLERTDNVARLIDVKYHLLKPAMLGQPDLIRDSVDIIQWMAVLKSCSALEAFRKVYLSRITPQNILEFLVLDRNFPRSIHFSVRSAKEALWRLSGWGQRAPLSRADRLMGRMEAELGFATIDDLLQKGLHGYLEEIEDRLVLVGEEVHLMHFACHTGEAPEAEPHSPLPFTGTRGGRAEWSQAQQQQQ